jgi:bifunctional DNase/RNase
VFDGRKNSNLVTKRRDWVMGVINKLKIMGWILSVGLCIAPFISPLGKAEAGMDLSPGSEKSKLLPVTVYRLILDPVSQNPVVILANSLEERALPIWIDNFEANAIHAEMEGIKHRRPLTHDLLERIIQKTHATIHQIVITQLKENIYYAKIRMEVAGTFTEIDARPSDSIVVALKFKAPLFVSRDLFKDKAMPLSEEKEIEQHYGLTLQNLTPSLSQAFSFDSTKGTLVSDVRRGSRAEKDGLERGDIFVAVDEGPVDDVSSVRLALEKGKTTVKAKIYRKGRFLAVSLHPDTE